MMDWTICTSTLQSELTAQVPGKVVDRSVIEEDRGRQPALDDFFQLARYLHGRARIQAVCVERFGRIDLRFGTLHPSCQFGDQPGAQLPLRQRALDGRCPCSLEDTQRVCPSVSGDADLVRFRRNRLSMVSRSGMRKSHTMPALASTARTHPLRSGSHQRIACR